jgi:hypothetical protein
MGGPKRMNRLATCLARISADLDFELLLREREIRDSRERLNSLFEGSSEEYEVGTRLDGDRWLVER